VDKELSQEHKQLWIATVTATKADKHYTIKQEEAYEPHFNVIRFKKTTSNSKLISKELIGGYVL
jgi:hypothetical protein